MLSPLITSRTGFSILIALGSTGVLLIIVVGMASVFLSEMRLSRLQYDSILSSTQAEGAFEYAMLKVRNHKDGFEDSMSSMSPDALIFSGASPRTDKVAVDYTIKGQSTDATFSGGNDSYTILPLFVGRCQGLIDATSCNPEEYKNTLPVTNILELSSSAGPSNLFWSIVAMSGSENISLAGTGVIDGSETGTMRVRLEKCFNSSGDPMPSTTPMNADGSCPSPYNELSGGESLTYFSDFTGSVFDFLNGNVASQFRDIVVTDPYLLIFTPGPPSDIRLRTSTPFTLPELEVTAEARKGDALQAIRFREDKSKYYDALKYGVYNSNP